MVFFRTFVVGAMFFAAARQLFACSWGYSIWSKDPRSDTALFRFSVNGELDGFIDRTGKVVIPPKFLHYGTNADSDFFQGMVNVTDPKTHEAYYIDETGRRLPRPVHAPGPPKKKNDGPEFVIDSGPCLKYEYGPCPNLPMVFDPTGPNKKTADGKIPACTFAAVNESGKVLFRTSYTRVGVYAEGLGPGSDGNRWGYIDTAGHLRIPLYFDGAGSFTEGLAPAQIGNSWGFVDRSGTFVVLPRYRGTNGFSEGVAAVELFNGQRIFVDHHGNRAVPGNFDDATSFVMGLAHVRKGETMAYIDKTGKSVFTYPRYEWKKQ